MRKRKILFGINRLSVGGGERIVLLQLAHIDRERFEPHLVTLLERSSQSFDEEADRLGIPWKKFAFKGPLDLASWGALYSYLRKEKFDIVVANLFFTAAILRAAAILARVPIILVSELNIYAGRTFVEKIIEKLLSFGTAQILAVSSDVKAFSSKQLGIPERKFTVAYSPVDIEAVRRDIARVDAKAVRARYGLADEIVITTAGRFMDQKGHRYLIEACRLLKERGYTGFRVRIFGEGRLEGDLRAQIQRENVSDIVSLPGVAPTAEIFAITDIFTMPSLWEGLSLALLEAMAAGKPIIATKVSGSTEAVIDGVSGLLVEPKDSEALASAFARLLDDHALRQSLAEGATAAAPRFSIDRMLDTVYGVIEEETTKRGL